MDTFNVAVRLCADARSRARIVPRATSQRDDDARCGSANLTVAGMAAAPCYQLRHQPTRRNGPQSRFRSGVVFLVTQELRNRQRVVQRGRVGAGRVRPAVRQRVGLRAVARSRPGPRANRLRRRRVRRAGGEARARGGPGQVVDGDVVGARRQVAVASTVSVTLPVGEVRAPTSTVSGRGVRRGYGRRIRIREGDAPPRRASAARARRR